MMSPFAINSRRPLQHFRRWLFIGWGIIVAIVLLSLLPDPGDILFGDFKPNDKLGHFIAYGILMSWFAQLYHAMRTRILLAVLFICMGISLEFLQGMTYYRTFDVYDMFANSVGVLIGYVFSSGVLGRLLLRFEQHLSRASTD